MPVFILLLFLGVAVLWLLLCQKMTTKKNMKKRMVQIRMVKKGFIGAIVLAVVLFGGAILGLMCTERIPAGYVGVVYNMNGGVDGEVLQ